MLSNKVCMIKTSLVSDPTASESLENVTIYVEIYNIIRHSTFIHKEENLEDNYSTLKPKNP